MARTQSNTSKPNLLYLSPVVPALSGNGLAMRAGMVLQLLSRHCNVSLLVVPLYPPSATPIPAELACLCCQCVVAPVQSATLQPSPQRMQRWFEDTTRWLHRPRHNRAKEPATLFSNVTFQIVHVFRLAMLPFARPYLESTGREFKRHLDLDDLESSTRKRLAALQHLHGNSAMAHFEETQAQRAETLETEVLHTFDRIYVCSVGDQQALSQKSEAQVCVLPNALRVPRPLPPKSKADPFTFLFVGTLGYYPNEDAILHFCTEVLPLIRQSTRQACRVTIVGTGATAGIRQLAHMSGVQLVGAVPDVAPWYRATDVVVVPLRAGGGTRIKVLEACSYRRPLVSTTLGVEGIDVHGEEHVLLGDTPGAFADQCVRLMNHPRLGELLANNAYELFMRSYTLEAISTQLETWF